MSLWCSVKTSSHQNWLVNIQLKEPVEVEMWKYWKYEFTGGRRKLKRVSTFGYRIALLKSLEVYIVLIFLLIHLRIVSVIIHGCEEMLNLYYLIFSCRLLRTRKCTANIPINCGLYSTYMYLYCQNQRHQDIWDCPIAWAFHQRGSFSHKCRVYCLMWLMRLIQHVHVGFFSKLHVNCCIYYPLLFLSK